jgi:acetyltransferase-like isoleucine patch superfamily enzyme
LFSYVLPTSNGARIGSHLILMDGSSVGAHSVVHDAIPEMIIAFGAPARVPKARARLNLF